MLFFSAYLLSAHNSVELKKVASSIIITFGISNPVGGSLNVGSVLYIVVGLYCTPLIT